MAIGDASFGEIVGCHLDSHEIPGQDAYVMHANLAGNVRKDRVAFVLFANQFDSEGGIGKAFKHFPLHLDNLFGHKSAIEQKR